LELDQLRQELLYLDKAFIADLYEVTTGNSPSTVISSSQGGKAGTNIPFFSAEVNAQESRAFSVSTLKMAAECFSRLDAEPTIVLEDLGSMATSRYGWVEGRLSVFRATSSRKRDGKTEETAATEHFQILTSAEDIALITTPEYFTSGISAFTKMQQTVLKDMEIGVRAYLRVFNARGYTGDWIATPLLMLEREVLQAATTH